MPHPDLSSRRAPATGPPRAGKIGVGLQRHEPGGTKSAGPGLRDLSYLTTAAFGGVPRGVAVIERHADLKVGQADTSIVVLANRHDTLDVLTFAERHFRLLPADR